MSDRFESYETTLRNCLTESKEALEAKGVEVSEETKLRNVPGLIDGIEVGHSGNAITINCKSDDFLGQTLTAKHTDGTTVTKTIDSLTCVIEIPKDGEWTVTNSLTTEKLKFTVDLTRDLYSFMAYLNVSISCNLDVWDEITASLKCVTAQDPSSNVKPISRIKDLNNYKVNTKNTVTYSNFPLDQKGNWTIGISDNFSTSWAVSKIVNINETGKSYSVSFIYNNHGMWYDEAGEQPSIGNEPQTQVETEPKWYGVNTTEMTEQQQEEIFNEIDKMIEQNKSDEEINTYISSKEAEYGQI